MTDLDKYIERVNKAFSDGKISQSKRDNLIAAAQKRATQKGEFGPQDRAKLNELFNAGVQQQAGSGGGQTGGGGTAGRPPRPGAAWVWSPAQNRWVKPPRPNVPPGALEQGTFAWDDEKGWVWTPKETPTPEPEPEPEPEDDEDEGQTPEERRNASEVFREMLAQFGFSGSDIDQLMTSFDEWMIEGFDNAAIMVKFRATDIYKRRFAGMAELIGRGQAINEAEYISLESSFRNTMANYGLPKSYYDTPEDYARLIGAGLSPKEVEERVIAAKQAMNPLVAAELRQYYDVSDGDLTAYMLGLTDEKGLALTSARNQEAIRTQGRAAQIGAAAERAGFAMDRAASERLAGTSVGQIVDPFKMGTLSQLEGDFDRARRIADRERTLAGIDREAYAEMDTLEAAFGDEQKRLASERRAKRERARFAGSSGTAAGSLGVERNF